MKIKVQQAYLQISKMDEAKPLIVTFTKDGATLTDEQLKALKIEIETDLKYESSILNGQSAMSIRILKTDDLTKGIHRVKVTAVGTDDIGKTIEGSDSALIEVRLLPPWIRWIIVGLILLVLLALLMLILNQKVLPKMVLGKGDTSFRVGGTLFKDDATVSYDRRAKTLTLTPPDVPGFPYVDCAARLSLKPVSPRRVRSAKRRIILIDNYIDDSALLMLAKRVDGVTAEIVTRRITETLSLDIERHNLQYPPVTARECDRFHDRFLIIDDTVYHLGASLKDLGKKLFAFNKMEIGAEVLFV